MTDKTYMIQETRETPAPHLGEDDVVTIKEASDVLGCTIQEAAGYLDRGTLTTVIDPEAPKRQGRRLFLRDELNEYIMERRHEHRHH